MIEDKVSKVFIFFIFISTVNKLCTERYKSRHQTGAAFLRRDFHRRRADNFSHSNDTRKKKEKHQTIG